MPNSNFYSNGKLLLTGEYLVLDGALALAVPTKLGQSLVIKPNTTDFIDWQSFDENHEIWYKNAFFKNDIESPLKHNHDPISQKLLDILHVAKQLNPDFDLSHISVETHLTFPRKWGLGTSSTLINNIANWAQVDPYELLNQTFGGSGYDIACAQHDSAITYQLQKPFDSAQGDNRIVKTVDFNPEFKDAIYFVYLNKKQNSRDAIKAYREHTTDLSQEIDAINTITKHIIACKSVNEFDNLLIKHEEIMSSILKQDTIKNRLFSNYEGAIKSLGAWGGDFVLVTATKNPSAYFKAKGFETVISFKDMLL